jgi:predicted metal-dependent peptidase
MGGNVSRDIADLVEGKVDWREQLADFVSATCAGRDSTTWRKPNRRHLAAGMYLPSLYSETIDDVVIAIDTSGSVGGDELREFLSEAVTLMEQVSPCRVHLLYWDTEVAGHEQYWLGDFDKMLSSTKPVGGGGTDIGSVFKYLEAERIEPQCVIVLSDLYTPWCSEPTVPVLFVSNSGVVAPFGKTIQI